ncbi:MAG: hypothetical protein JO356_08820 [Acidobacteria bacterium]|nr:hypothetical protein [Acidobacteriota bacterium]
MARPVDQLVDSRLVADLMQGRFDATVNEGGGVNERDTGLASEHSMTGPDGNVLASAAVGK